MPPRILHTYKSYMPEQTGGVAEVIAASVTTPGFDHRVLVTRRSLRPLDYVWESAAVRAVPAWATVSSMPFAPRYPIELIRMAAQSDLLVHHAPFPLTDLSLLAAGAARMPPFLVHWHADLVRSAWLVKAVAPLLSRTLRRAKAIIVSDAAIIDGTPTLHDHRDKCVVIPYGLDTTFWSADPPEGATRRPRMLACAGRLVSYKGYEVLLHAIRGLDVSLTIIGTGPLRAPLEALAQRLGVAERVRFAGYLSKEAMRGVFQQAELFVFPSLSTAESFGLVQVEAMAAGLPIVNTAIASAVPHVARDGIEGLTVPPGDATALARAIETVLGDAALRHRMQAAARQRAGVAFGMERFRHDMAAAYHAAMQTDGATPA